MIPTITGPLNGELGDGYEVSYEDLEGDDVYFRINWGDGRIQNWDGPYKSGEVVKSPHSWSPISFPGGGDFKIVVQAKDENNLLSKHGNLKVRMNVKGDQRAAPLIKQLIDMFIELIPKLGNFLKFKLLFFSKF